MGEKCRCGAGTQRLNTDVAPLRCYLNLGSAGVFDSDAIELISILNKLNQAYKEKTKKWRNEVEAPG